LIGVTVVGHDVAPDNAAATEGDLDPVLGDEIHRTETLHFVVEDVGGGLETANDDPALLIQGDLVAADGAAREPAATTGPSISAERPPNLVRCSMLPV
jgi:hypothetical protein